jgi:hypothetical protein
VGSELGAGIALCTTWADGDMKTWATLAKDALDQDPARALGEVTHVAVQLARALASAPGSTWSEPADVLQHLALDAEKP